MQELNYIIWTKSLLLQVGTKLPKNEPILTGVKIITLDK